MSVDSDAAIETVTDPSYYLAEGLVHDVYARGDRVYKIPKQRFQRFHSRAHFLVEKFSLETLGNAGIPTPDVYGVTDRLAALDDRPVLVEERIDGIERDGWQDLSEGDISSLRRLYGTCTDIGIDGYGTLRPDGSGPFDSWRDFLTHVIMSSGETLTDAGVFSPTESERVQERLLQAVDRIGYDGGSRLVLRGLNPGNVLFTPDNDLAGVIDVDITEGGDPRYDIGCLAWYAPDFYRRTADHWTDRPARPEPIRVYRAIEGLRVLNWRQVHDLGYDSQRELFDSALGDVNWR